MPNINSLACFFGLMACFGFSGCGLGGARPQADELYEVRSTEGRQTVQIVTTRWSDGSYRDLPIIQFRDGQGNSWVVACPNGKPENWEIVHIDEYQTPETLKAAKSMTLPGPWIYKLRFMPSAGKRSATDSTSKAPHERL
jgi:hypothetical protein